MAVSEAQIEYWFLEEPKPLALGPGVMYQLGFVTCRVCGAMVACRNMNDQEAMGIHIRWHTFGNLSTRPD
jgi:hypothetical protein